MRVSTAEKNSNCSPFLDQSENYHASLRAWARAAANLGQTVTCFMSARFDTHGALRLEELSDSQLRDIGLRRHAVAQIDPRTPGVF
jgi:uncharacterized protein YjiS (DUF1127 family)